MRTRSRARQLASRRAHIAHGPVGKPGCAFLVTGRYLVEAWSGLTPSRLGSVSAWTARAAIPCKRAQNVAAGEHRNNTAARSASGLAPSSAATRPAHRVRPSRFPDTLASERVVAMRSKDTMQVEIPLSDWHHESWVLRVQRRKGCSWRGAGFGQGPLRGAVPCLPLPRPRLRQATTKVPLRESLVADDRVQSTNA
jgi:hypothetical protein